MLNSAVFQAGGLIVVLIEVGRKAYLASIVPVIVNAILNEHQIVVDIVAFVNRGDFPRSRLGEKQRGKILASWVSRKMRTMAQFGIRDPETALSDVTETMEPRSRVSSLRNGGAFTSSLRNVEAAPAILEQREYEQQVHPNLIPMPPGISEMPTINYDEKAGSLHDDETPTADNRHDFQFELPANSFDSNKHEFLDRTDTDRRPLSIESDAPDAPPSRIGVKPMNLPLNPPDPVQGDLWSLPSQQRGGLRVQNAASDDEDDSWKNDAIMHMNLAGGR